MKLTKSQINSLCGEVKLIYKLTPYTYTVWAADSAILFMKRQGLIRNDRWNDTLTDKGIALLT